MVAPDCDVAMTVPADPVTVRVTVRLPRWGGGGGRWARAPRGGAPAGQAEGVLLRRRLGAARIGSPAILR
jgi:hypothetical protein